MNRLRLFFGLCFFCLPCLAQPGGSAITMGTLLEEMSDLERLARWPEPAYRTVQFSSYDRRSTTSEAPGWFSNADGFGGEPIPGFLKVLRPPDEGQNGLYLLAQATGPGAIVRGWSAAMNGVLRVYLDPTKTSDGTLVYEGRAYGFLARRSGRYLKAAGLTLDAANAFSQEDADYFPIPFAKGLKVTWEGKLNELHFYHLQVRLYGEGAAVRSFDPQTGVKPFEPQIRAAVPGLTTPRPRSGEATNFAPTIEPGRAWSWSPTATGAGAVRELKLGVQGEHRDDLLRGCLLRIAFDGSQRPQVEAPLGDFFGSGPGVNPFNSLPFTVEPDGTMTCRFVMPYEKTLRLEILNFTPHVASLEGSIRVGPWQWDERSLYFRAKWRADHDLLAGGTLIDLPYVLTIGKGVFVGCAAMIMNPSGVPTASGNWWGEGDEKFIVDGEATPSTFGTGSEDYFNYSWSRPGLFANPYGGQPLDSGPDTSGYISNHRFQVMEAIPFERSFAGLMELWAHNLTPGLSYARIAYHYARPGAVDDHRGLMPSDLRIPKLPKREPQALRAAKGARFYFLDQMQPQLSSGKPEIMPFALATQLQVLAWKPGKGDTLKCTLPIEKDGRVSLHLVAVHRPDGAAIRVLLDGKPLSPAGGPDSVPLRSAYAHRDLNVHFKPIEAKAGAHELAIECVEAGQVAVDYIWVKPE